MAAMVTRDGNEHHTIQYAQDGVNFEVASITSLLPNAAGSFVPDAFTGSGDGRGITWGISHFTNATNWSENHAILTRFDCDLSLDVDDQEMKRHNEYYQPEFYYGHGLSSKQMEERRKSIKD